MINKKFSHFDFYSEQLESLLLSSSPLHDKTLAIDIGSNDGLFLRCIKKRLPVNVLGIEPAEGPRLFSEENGIPAIDSFFSSSLAKDLKKQFIARNQSVGIISANNVFAHSRDLNKFIQNMSLIKHIFIFT